MVSSPHEAMHRIFQQYPDLFSGVSEVLGIDFPTPASVTVLPNDLTETSPVERRVDTLLRLDPEDGEPLLLAVEAQSGKNPDKPASWVYYASYMLNKYRLQPLLLVVCQDRATAEWAAREVSFGPRQWPLLTLRPLVAGPHNMPVITDPAEARKDLALATLSAITHAAHPDAGAILKSMTTVLRDTPQSIADPIIELIAQGLGKHPAAHLWRKLVAVDLSFYKSFISEEIRDEGRAQGAVRRAAEDVLDILEVRGIDIPDAVRERVTDCDDPEILRQWHRRAVTAPTAAEIFEDE
ncbi:hypothetical protein ACH5AO_18710 [Streptomyces sp. NPDC018964]|uniref:hypothetical protein n=1 Tax=unclassified Streptomyces TaxID=2593676 RepID=UPI00379E8B7B